MNKKIVAIIIPLMMVLSGVVVAANTVADTSTYTTTVNENRSFTVGDSFLLEVNEANYINYNYTSEWKIGETVLAKSENSLESERSASSVDPATSGGVKYSIVPEKATGSYRVTTERVEGELSETPIVWEITIVIDNNSDNGSKKLKLTMTLEPASQDEVKFVWASESHKNPIVNMVYDEAIVAKFGDASITTDSNPSYYAIGLPEGLSMSSNGHINGIAKNKGEFRVNVAVSYTDSGVKKIATGTLDIIVDSSSKIEFTMYLVNNSETAPGVEIKDGSFYIVVQANDDSPMKLTISPTDGKWHANAHVKVVSSSGVVSEESKYNDAFNIPINGTGAYTVIVIYAGVTQSFTLYVLPAGALSADIIISGN